VPNNFNLERARWTACWAEDILHSAKHYSSLEDALGDCHDVVGFSTRSGKNRTSYRVLNDWVEEYQPTEIDNNQAAKTALVFGPEASGLTQEDVGHCRLLVRIPSSPECPSYNLAQSVVISLWELSKQNFNGKLTKLKRELPKYEEFYQLDKMIEELLTRIGFYTPSTPQPIPDLVKALFRRTQPDQREMSVLLGIFGKLSRRG
jgi:tRNA/rRNA methyltransferase